MTTIIIAVVIIAIIALLIVRARQGKDGASTAKGKGNKTSAKNTKKTDAAPAPAVESSAKPSIDLSVLLNKIDLLISDKEFAKAEGMINQSLKQDGSLHPLYEKLLKLYHAQEDDFAVNQLLENLQKLNLNEVYQRVYKDHEEFKAEQEKAASLVVDKKSPEVFEFTPSSGSNTADFDSLSQSEAKVTETTDNSLEFANLSSNFTDSAPAQSSTLEFASSTPSDTVEPSTQSNELDFNLNAPAEQAPVAEAEQSFNFNLDANHLDTAPVEASPTAPASEPSLDFKFDLESPTPTASPSTSLDFNLETPAQATQAPSATEINLDFSLDTPAVSSPEITEAPASETAFIGTENANTFADLNDPIVQTFTDLAQTDPIELHIELAEQYIRIGAFAAAKSLLATSNETASAEQNAKIDGLLQKIAS